MRHRYECPLRWADLDLLGHVNNVTYLNYLREARRDFFTTLGRAVDSDNLAEGLNITRNQVNFAAPLLFRHRPVSIELWTSDIDSDGFVLNYEIFDDSDGARIVYTKVRAEAHVWDVASGAPRGLTPAEQERLREYSEPALEFSPVLDPAHFTGLPSEYSLAVRLCDLDIYRRVSDAVYFEYFQEARVKYLYELAERVDESSSLVLARTDIAYHHPIRLRSEPYRIRSGVARVGNSSFTVVAQLLDGDVVAASATVILVAFDPQTQAAATLRNEQRDALLKECESVTMDAPRP